MDPKHAQEIVTMQYGCFRSGVTFVPVTKEDPQAFFAALADKSVKGAVISPNRRVDGNLKQSEVLLNNIPELKTRNLSLLQISPEAHSASRPIRISSSSLRLVSILCQEPINSE